MDATAELDIVTALLRRYSYAPIGGIPGRYEIWTDDAGRDQVVVPEDPTKSDFGQLLDRALSSVLLTGGPEASQWLDMLRMKLEAALDSTRWEQETPTEAGVIGWLEGEALFTSARNSLVAAAKATVQRRRQFGKAQAYVSRQLLENALMGQTEIGSFIVTAHIPSARRFHTSKRSEVVAAIDGPPKEQQTVSGREILGTFSHALEAVRHGLEEYRRAPRPEVFLELVHEGVSYELTDSLRSLTERGDAAIQIDYYDRATSPRFEVDFVGAESIVLAKAAKTLLVTAEPEYVALEGEVTLLDNESSHPVRLVRISTKVHGQPRRVKVRLTPEQYDLAIEAHRLKVPLHVAGRLEKDGKSYWLYDPEGVRIVATEGMPTGLQDPFDFRGL